MVYIEYIESAPHSNPTLSKNRKYRGIGAALLAYGVQLSIDSGYGGTIDLAYILHFQKICKRYNIDFATADEDERDFVIRMAEKSFYSMRA